MKGLFLKDFYSMKESLGIIMAICIIIAILLGVIWNNTTIVVGFTSAILELLIIFGTLTISMTLATTIMTDKKDKWTRFLITTPLSKKQIISSKYIEYALYAIVSILITFFIGLVVTCFSHSEEKLFMLRTIVSGAGFAFIITFLCGSIIIPSAFVVYKDKSALSSIMIFLTTFFSFLFTVYAVIGTKFLIYNVFKYTDYEKENLIIIVTCAIFSFIIYLLSWYISQKKIRKI